MPAPPRVELEPTEDVLSALALVRHPGQVLVGFAAEHGEDAVAYGRGKLERKGSGRRLSSTTCRSPESALTPPRTR